MAGSQVAISALPASTVFATADILPIVHSGVTNKITGANFRTQLFAFAAADPLNCGILTATGNSTITGTLSGVTTFTATSITATAAIGLPALNQNLTFSPDATYDIGQSGATRPRDLFTSRNVSVGGTLALAGNIASDVLFTDGLYDIGKAGATRPRDIFASRNFTTATATFIQDNGTGLGTSYQATLRSGVSGHRAELHLTDNVTSDAYLSFLPSATAAIATITLAYNTTPLLTLTGAGNATFAGSLALTGAQNISINGSQVVASRVPGWATQTTAESRADMGASPTLATTYQTLAALIQDLKVHGLI